MYHGSGCDYWILDKLSLSHHFKFIWVLHGSNPPKHPKMASAMQIGLSKVRPMHWDQAPLHVFLSASTLSVSEVHTTIHTPFMYVGQ